MNTDLMDERVSWKHFVMQADQLPHKVECSLNYSNWYSRKYFLYCYADERLPFGGIKIGLNINHQLNFESNSYSPETYKSFPVGDEKKHPYLNSNDCEELDRHCPMRLMEMSSYTDL
jgi:hypothetical protein